MARNISRLLIALQVLLKVNIQINGVDLEVLFLAPVAQSLCDCCSPFPADDFLAVFDGTVAPFDEAEGGEWTRRSRA